MEQAGASHSPDNPFADLARGPVSARLDFWLESGAEVKALIDEALMSGLRAADAALFDEVLDQAPARLKVPSPVVDWPPRWGAPGGVCANLLSSWEPTGRARTLRHRDGPLTRRRMDWITDPEREVPFAVGASMSRLDHRGVPAATGPDGEDENADYKVTCWVLSADGRETHAPPGWSVTVKARLAGPGAEPPPARLDWVRQLADRPALRFAEVGWFLDLPSFEHVHGPRRFERSRIYLADRAARGYNWVTVLSQALAAQISPSRRVEAEQALFELVDLPHGALWAQGTQDFQGFYGQRLREMFLLCAEVLPTGPMNPVPSRHPLVLLPEYPVVYEDAAEYGSTVALPSEW